MRGVGIPGPVLVHCPLYPCRCRCAVAWSLALPGDDTDSPANHHLTCPPPAIPALFRPISRRRPSGRWAPADDVTD